MKKIFLLFTFLISIIQLQASHKPTISMDTTMFIDTYQTSALLEPNPDMPHEMPRVMASLLGTQDKVEQLKRDMKDNKELVDCLREILKYNVITLASGKTRKWEQIFVNLKDCTILSRVLFLMIDIDAKYIEHLKSCILSIPCAISEAAHMDVETDEEYEMFIFNAKIQLAIFDRKFYDEIKLSKVIPQSIIDFLDNNRFTGLELFCTRYCEIDCTPI